MGRNEKELERLKEHVKKGTPRAGIQIIKLTRDENTDKAALQTFGIIDATLDISPPNAAKSTHLKIAINSPRKIRKYSLMGSGECHTVNWKVVGDNITLKGKLIYERDDIVQFVNMLEIGSFL